MCNKKKAGVKRSGCVDINEKCGTCVVAKNFLYLLFRQAYTPTAGEQPLTYLPPTPLTFIGQYLVIHSSNWPHTHICICIHYSEWSLLRSVLADLAMWVTIKSRSYALVAIRVMLSCVCRKVESAAIIGWARAFAYVCVLATLWKCLWKYYSWSKSGDMLQSGYEFEEKCNLWQK